MKPSIIENPALPEKARAAVEALGATMPLKAEDVEAWMRKWADRRARCAFQRDDGEHRHEYDGAKTAESH